MNATLVCGLADIDEDGATGLIAEVGGKQRNIIAIRRGGEVYAYLNWCPHAQGLLDHIEGRFFNGERTLLRCGVHGALFRIEDGYCVDGPCIGDSLTALKIEIRGGELYLID